MTRSKFFDPKLLLRSASAVLIAASLMTVTVSYAEARQEEEQVNRQMSAAIGGEVLEAQEAAEIEDHRAVVSILSAVLNEDPSPYEQSVIYRLRGTSYYAMDNVNGAIRDFQSAIGTGALVSDERIALRTNIGQLFFLQEQYQRGIQEFEAAIREGAELTPRLAKLLAQAYVQAGQDAGDRSASQARDYYTRGLRYAELFYRGEPNKAESDYNLMQFYYIELNRPQDELRVIRDSLQAYPGSRRSWSNLVSIFARLDREDEAFEANKLMYLNGLFEDEEELFRLVQYYSYYSNPFRGASILEREMNAGRIPATQQRLESLANMWRQAAEFDRAIPVLERLSEQIGDGETALKLAEAYYQENDLPRAETALETALARGGLDETGKAWELLGNVRFSQDKLGEALQAFNRGTDYSATRRTSADWIRFVNAQIAGAERRAIQREQVQIEECALTIDAERRQLVLIGTVGDDGAVEFPEGTIPDRCLYYFDGRSGIQIREAGWSDAEFEAAQAERAERAAAAAEAAG